MTPPLNPHPPPTPTPPQKNPEYSVTINLLFLYLIILKCKGILDLWNILNLNVYNIYFFEKILGILVMI
jgi:hypothetical protein